MITGAVPPLVGTSSQASDDSVDPTPAGDRLTPSRVCDFLTQGTLVSAPEGRAAVTQDLTPVHARHVRLSRHLLAVLGTSVAAILASVAIGGLGPSEAIASTSPHLASPSVTQGTLEICKVNGLGVPAGTPIMFDYTAPGHSGTVTVDAGPAPSGNCEVVGTFPIGAYKVSEVKPPGDTVTAITDVPAGGTVNLGAGSITGKFGPGTTVITFSDQDVQKGTRTGYLEICKRLTSSNGKVPAYFTFSVAGQSVDVPPNSCSQPIEVFAGTATITEAPSALYQMMSCAASPAAALVSCTPSSMTATVSVKSGGVAGKTTIIVTNSPALKYVSVTSDDDGYCGVLNTGGVNCRGATRTAHWATVRRRTRAFRYRCVPWANHRARPRPASSPE